MDSSWRDLLVLLRGNTCVSVTCEVISDLAEQNIEVLPDLFHEVVFDLLVSNVSHVRLNGCMLLKLLCRQFAWVLKPLLSLSCTDGVLFTIDDIDITKVVKCSGGQLLGASSVSDASSTVYTTGWLKTQVNELRARIGLESSSEVVADASQYDNVGEILQSHDLREAHKRVEVESEASDDFLPCQLNVFSVEQTLETWFARLLRVMIVGLLSATWEVRHGYAIGLTYTLEGLYPELMNGSTDSVAVCQLPDDEEKLPGFLCDDILCCGFCVLLLDRFMDFGCGESGSVSPVKEAAGSLVACALRCAESSRRRDKAWKLIVEMTSSDALHWTVTLGGLIALKSFVRNNLDFVLFERPDQLSSLVLRGMGSAATEQEEVACCACEVLEVLSQACAQPLQHLSSSALGNALECLYTLATGVDEIVGAGVVGAQSPPQWEVPACIAKFGSAVRSLCQIMRSLLHGQNCFPAAMQGQVQLVLRLTEVQRKLVGMLFAFTESVQRRCMRMCSESLQCLRSTLSRADFRAYLTTCPDSIMQEVRASFFSLLGNVLCASCVSSQFPCVDLQLEDSSSAAAAKSGKVGGAADVALEQSVSSLGAATAVCSTFHADASMWRGIVEQWMAITALIGDSPSHEQVTVSVREIVVHVVKSGGSGYRLAPSGIPEGSVGFKSALSTFQSTLRRFVLRETEPFARAAAFRGSSALRAPDDRASAWAFAGDARSGKLVAVLAALAVGAGAVGVDGLLRAVSDGAADSALVSGQEPADAPHPSRDQLTGLACVTVAPKKRRFVVVADDCEGPKLKKGAVPADPQQNQQPREIGFSSSASVVPPQTPVLVTLSLLVLEVQLRAPQSHEGAGTLARVRRELRDAIALRTGPAGQADVAAELVRSLLVPSISSAVTAASSDAFAATKLEVRLALATATAHVILSASPCTELFNVLAKELTSETRTERTSSWFAQVTIYALMKNCGESFHQVFTSCILTDDASGVGPQSLWSMCSALAACSRAVREELMAAHDLLDIVFRSLAQAGEDPSDEVVKGAVAVLCLLTDAVQRGDLTGQIYAEDDDTVATLREIGVRLFGFLSREGTEPPAGFPCARRRASEVFYRLAQQRLDAVVHCYEVWFAAALHGIADNEPAVRRSCVSAFRLLVPLASVAKRTSLRQRNAVQQAALPSCDLIDHIFTKQSALKIQLSERPQDLNIMAVLSAKTNLWVQSCSGLHTAQLRAYQWEGVSWLTQLRRFGLNGILADEMGLGKSLQALTALAVQRIESNCRTEPSLIVCPATLVLHWEEEVARYFPPDLLRPVRWYSSALPGAAALEGRDVVIASYEVVRRDVSRAGGSSLLGRLWETVVADEAHLIKNPAAGTTKAVCSLQSKHRIALSGTPLQNQVEELWSLMNFVLPDYIGDYQSFRRETVLPIQQSFCARKELKRTASLLKASFEETSAPAGAAKKKRDSSLAKFHTAIEVSAVGLSLLRTLHKQVLPFILRRTKEMVAKDLPSKTIVDVLCPLSAQQAQLYEAHLKAVNITDEQVERELKLIDADEGRSSGASSEENIDIEALKQAMKPPNTQAGSNFSGWGGMGSLGGIVLPAFEEAPPAPPRRSALQSLNYLKLLGVHPALVVADGSYKARLLKSHTSSGKLFKLANLLLESGVMTRDDFSADRDIAELEGDLDDPVKPENIKKGEESEGQEEGGGEAADGSECDVPLAPDDNVSITKKKTAKEKSKTAKGKSNPDKSLSESITTSAAADHACRSAGAELLPPMHRCLIFAQHRAALDLVEEHVMRRYFPEVGYQRLDGSVDAAKRAAIARKFNAQERRNEPVSLYVPAKVPDDEETRAAQVQLLKGRLPAAATAGQAVLDEQRPSGAGEADIRVLLLTTRACGLGLNLTAADTVIFLEHDWNPFADLQAMDRVHRLGQTHPVTVYRLLAESTVEARIMRLQGLKRNIADQVINEDNAGEAAASYVRADGAEPGSSGNTGSGKQFGTALMESLLHL